MKEVNGDICTLELLNYVSHRRWRGAPMLGSLSDIDRGGDAQDLDEKTTEPPASGGAATRKVFGKMREGRFVMFVIKGESPSNLRIAERF